MTLTAFATLSVRALSAASVTLKTLRACERALAAWALTADTSFEVTLPVPPAVAEIRLLRASMIDCMPRVLTLPAERAEIAERSTDTADQMEASFTDALFDTTLPILTAFAEALLLTTLSADVLLLISFESALETMLAALLAALATLRAFDAAVDTMLAALLAAFATLKALDAAFETVLMCVSRAALAAARTLISFDTTLLMTETAWLKAECA